MSNGEWQVPAADDLGKGWPEQRILDHAPYWRAWRAQARQDLSQGMTQKYHLVGREWCKFANGKNLDSALMVQWYHHTAEFPVTFHGSKTGKLSPARHTIYCSLVRNYLKWLALMRAIQIDPGPCIPIVHQNPPAPKQVFTPDEYRKIKDLADSRLDWNPHAWMICLGYHTGMSPVDCARLRWDEVTLPDEGQCYIRKIRQKTGRLHGAKTTATIPIIVGSELWVAIKRLHNAHLEDLTFGDAGEWVHDQAYELYYDPRPMFTYEIAEIIRKALGDKHNGRTFRHFRNTFASRLINAGNDAVLVSKMTGHTKVDQLADYVVPDQSALQNALLKGLRHAAGEPTLPSSTAPQDQAPPLDLERGAGAGN